jgi:hypothetical protein
MRTQLLTLIAMICLVAATTTAAAAAPGSAAADSTQSASWTQRKLMRFSPPSNYVPANGYLSNTHFLSCDELIDRMNFLLSQLGARDISVDQRDCRRGGVLLRSIDVTFSVLAPTDNTPKPGAGAPVEAHWKTVELGGADVGLGDCAFLKYATIKILPLFSTREVKLIPTQVCAKVGVGLRAQVLEPPPQLASSP